MAVENARLYTKAGRRTSLVARDVEKLTESCDWYAPQPGFGGDKSSAWNAWCVYFFNLFCKN